MHSQLQLCLRLCAANTSRCNSPRCRCPPYPSPSFSLRRRGPARDGALAQAFVAWRIQPTDSADRGMSLTGGSVAKLQRPTDPFIGWASAIRRCGQDGGYPVQRSV